MGEQETKVENTPAPAPTPAKKKPAAGVVQKIENVKGAKVKISVKKVKGAAKYSIRVTAKKDKKGTVHTSKSNVFVHKFSKCGKITAQARVKNSAGWGAYGKKKSFTTDKK